MIVVTGAAGFIGSCLVARLNEMGREDLILIDDIDKPDPREAKGFKSDLSYLEFKRANLKNKKFEKYLNKDAFLQSVSGNQLNSGVNTILHMGACSSTTLDDAQYFQKNNFEYTQALAQWALEHNARFIYASSAATYGDGSIGYKDDEQTIRRCNPLNLYGKSKQDFDAWCLDKAVADRMVGLKFFNVFGPNEYHKGDMRSVVAKAYQRVVDEGKIGLFKSYKEEYADGEQKRDFIYVKDAVDVILFFIENPHVNGIFNVGTGKARTWNDLAHALFKAVGKSPDIEYFEMPEDLRPRYQYFTEADVGKLRECGYTKPFTSLEDGISDYVQYLKEHRYW